MSYEATWTCSCGARNGNDNNFCTTCGSRKPAVSATPAAAYAPANVCPKCGKTVEGGQTFCIWCGTRLGAAAPKAEPVAATSYSSPEISVQQTPKSYGGLRKPTDEDLA